MICFGLHSEKKNTNTGELSRNREMLLKMLFKFVCFENSCRVKSKGTLCLGVNLDCWMQECSFD